MLAYTGLETVANLAEEATRAGPDAAALALLRDRARRRRDGPHRRDRPLRLPGLERRDGARRRVARGAARRDRRGVRRLAARRRSSTRSRSRSASRASLILVGAATTSFSGITRLTHSLAEHGSLPREFARLERRALVSSEAIAIAAGARDRADRRHRARRGRRPGVPRGLYSFGVLIAFTAAQLAVIRLRMREPDLARPFRARPNVTDRAATAPARRARRRAAHVRRSGCSPCSRTPGARYAGPAWLAVGPRRLRRSSPPAAARAARARRAGRGAAGGRRVRAASSSR